MTNGQKQAQTQNINKEYGLAYKCIKQTIDPMGHIFLLNVPIVLEFSPLPGDHTDTYRRASFLEIGADLTK